MGYGNMDAFDVGRLYEAAERLEEEAFDALNTLTSYGDCHDPDLVLVLAELVPAVNTIRRVTGDSPLIPNVLENGTADFDYGEREETPGSKALASLRDRAMRSCESAITPVTVEES